MLLRKKPNQISAKFAACAIKRPMIPPILAIYWGKLMYVQIWPIKVHPYQKVQPQTADYVWILHVDMASTVLPLC